MSKNIVFSNQKGGVGKTTIATLFANYSVLSQNEKVTCFDFDPQESFYENYVMDMQMSPDSKPLYQVEKFDLEDSEKVIDLVNQYDGIAIYDLPGKLDDDNLLPLLINADAIVCPFHYDKFNLDPTLTFAMVVEHLNKETNGNTKLYFLPNRIKRSANYDSKNIKDDKYKKAPIDFELEQYGEILPFFPELKVFQEINIFTIPSRLSYYVSRSFEKIYKDIISN